MRPFSLLSAASWLLCFPAAGQNAGPGARPVKKVHPAAGQEGLRVTHVSLYKNGVGFFEHEGVVVGDGTVSLDLTSAQLNDVLGTLTAADLGGGHITGANYNSTTPLEQQLRTLPLSLGEQPSEEALYAALRGARVEVTGSGPAFTGRILSLQIVDPPADPTPADAATHPPSPARMANSATLPSSRTLEQHAPSP